MGNAGTIKVSLTAEQTQFVAGMQAAADQLDKFGKACKNGTEHVKKFDAHMLTGRHTIAAFAALGDTPAAPLMHMIYAFQAFPGPAGIALGLLVAWKTAQEKHAEYTRRANEETKKFVDTMRSVSQLTGDNRTGEYFNRVSDELDKVNAKIAEQKKNATPGISIAELEKAQRQLQGSVEIYRKLDEAAEKFHDKEFNAKMGAGKGGLKLNEQLELAREKIKELGDAFSQLPNDLKLKKEFEDAQLQYKELQQEKNKKDLKGGGAAHLASATTVAGVLALKLEHHGGTGDPTSIAKHTNKILEKILAKLPAGNQPPRMG
jgi:hypothetical protein